MSLPLQRYFVMYLSVQFCYFVVHQKWQETKRSQLALDVVNLDK